MASIIRIEIYAGLCNRMRALDSAIQLAEANNSQLEVIWNLERKFNCRFDELFLVPKCISNIIYRDMRTIPRIIAGKLSNLFHIQSDNCFFQKDIDRLIRNEADFVELTADKTTFISTYIRYFSLNQNFREFTVEDSLQQIIRAYADRLENAVGVHIRRTDNRKATRSSPTSLFIKYMEREVINQPESRFFLATDSPEVETELVGIFEDRIIVHPKRSLDRDDPDAIKDALIDLYCLANCRKILGSYWSSFTDTASELYGAERIVVKTS